MIGSIRCCKEQFCFLEGYAAINKMINIYEYFNLLTISFISAAAMIELRNLWAVAIIVIGTQ